MQDRFDARETSELEQIYNDRTAVVGIVGLGYVGMPLAMAALSSGFRVVGIDIDEAKICKLNEGESYIRHVPSSVLAEFVSSGQFRATIDFASVKDVDAIVLCVPTPLTMHREPDLSYVENTTRAIAPYIRAGHLVVLESTTWPGTTDEVVRPLIEAHGLRSGRDFFIAFSPEREDPGNERFSTGTIPKVVGADDPVSRALVHALYSSIMTRTVPVSSSRTAEAVKLTENIFRAVNIALVNELKIVYQAMGIDVWEVIDAASTKPFGFMPFYPGPGLGGHCIPIDPFYLTWKAREHEISTRFIELAGEINTGMPAHVIRRAAEALDARTGRGLNGAHILIVGMAYKKNVEDIRESPALKLMELLDARGATTHFYDPFIVEIPSMREYPHLRGRKSIAWNPDALSSYDFALIATDHDNVDYSTLCNNIGLIVDTRNVCARRGIVSESVVKA